MFFRCKGFIVVLLSTFLYFPLLCKKTVGNEVLLGIDVLIQNDFKLLWGKKVGLLTNSASRSREQKLTVEYFVNNPNFTLKAIFTPEHGFYTTIPAGKFVPDDTIYGVPLFSLYGNNRKPTPYQMSLIDVIVVDLQDVGVRSYTFISTLYNVMLASAESGVQVIVLDRPNPLGGNIVDGNVLEPEKVSFVGIIPVPYLHGCTIGELATMINEEGWLGKNGIPKRCKLTVVKMENWRREMKWEDTGLEWIPTSPNVTTPDAIRGLAMLGALGELKIFNLGVGTSLPFQFFSIPRVNFSRVRSLISKLNFDGVVFKAVYNKKSIHRSKQLGTGFQIFFDRSKDIKLFTLGMNLLFKVRKEFPELFKNDNMKSQSIEMFKKVTGTDKLFDCLIESNETKFKSLLSNGLNDFIKLRSKYLFYR
mgnify:CR=1 FL=1